MKIWLLRHGRTAYNDEGRYQGLRDIPLSAAGEAELLRADFMPERLWVSPLSRARRTAEILFPAVTQEVVENLREMDFGAFEGISYREMENDPDYRAWVDGGCRGRCPGGEDRVEFSRRICAAVRALVEEALEQGLEQVAVVSHGGSLMAAMEGLALPERDYFDWSISNAGGYLLETDLALWRGTGKLQLVKAVSYLKSGVYTDALGRPK